MDELSREYAFGDEDILEKVREVFADAQYPGDDNLVTVPDHWEYSEMAEDFKGKHWKEIPTSLAVKWRTSTFVFTSQAFCFYFPAFVIAGWGDRKGSDIAGFFIQEFVPPAPNTNRQKEFLDRMETFTPDQKDLLKIILERYIADSPVLGWKDEEKDRIKEFWGIKF
jgi:hypothetical protein